ncbi:MAG: M1 family metallopeptidase [Sediminibacterium sp.]
MHANSSNNDSLMITNVKSACLLFMAIFIIGNGLNGQGKDISYLSSGGKLKPLQAIQDIRHYTINLDVNIAEKKINGNCIIDLNLSKQTDTLLFDLVHLLTVEKIKVNGAAANFTQLDDKIFITNKGNFAAGKQKVDISYGGEPPVAVKPPWSGGFTWAKDVKGNDWISINCQKEGGRLYFPCKDHPSDEPNEGVSMNITVPADLVVAGPGLLQKTVLKNNRKTYSWNTNYTISNYCVVFNIGRYVVATDNYTTINGNLVPIQFYVLECDSAEARKLIATKIRDTRILEKYFGEYPWVKEKIGIAEVPNSGMEHQTMITFNNQFKYEKIGGQDYSANLYHEYAHEWWANKVTNKDWAHMWIQEGIATYAEALGHYELGGQEAYDKIIDGHRRGIRFRKPMVGGEELSEDETYAGNDIYVKGSFFMHSLRYLIGDALFFPTLKKLATDPATTYDNFVTSADVEQLFSKATNMDLKPFFNFYLRTTDVLDISIKEIAYQQYLIKINNHFMDLPFDITANGKTERMTIPKDGLKLMSVMPPMVDGKGYYLKKISIL